MYRERERERERDVYIYYGARAPARTAPAGGSTGARASSAPPPRSP